MVSREPWKPALTRIGSTFPHDIQFVLNQVRASFDGMGSSLEEQVPLKLGQWQTRTERVLPSPFHSCCYC